MLPLLFVVLGAAFLLTGIWPVALAAFVCAGIGMKADQNAEEAVEAARSVGLESQKWNVIDGCFTLGFGALLIVAVLVVLELL